MTVNNRWDSGTHSEAAKHTEPMMFFGSEIVIWSALAGAYLLIPKKLLPLTAVAPADPEITSA